MGLLRLPEGRSSETDHKSIVCHKLPILTTWVSTVCLALSTLKGKRKYAEIT